MIKGHDFLGIGNKHFDVEATIKAISPGSIVGCFDSTWQNNFGNPFPKIRRLIESGKTSAVRCHLFWSYAHTGATVEQVRQACNRWEDLAIEFPQIKIFLSPSCEYGTGTSKKLVQDWIKVLRNRAPHCVPVLAPLPGAYIIPGVLIERHGDKGGVANGIGSTDGNNIWDANSKRIVDQSNNAVALLGWIMRYNLAQSEDQEDPNAPRNPIPPLRTAAPTYHDIKAVDVLLYPPLENKTELVKPELWKTAAEDKVPLPGKPTDPRANKPVLMVKEKVSQVVLLDSAFTEIGTLGLYPDDKNPPLQRYYSKYPGGSGKYAFEYGDIARRNTGSDVIYAQIGKRRVRIGSAAFRVPFYQS